MILSLEQDLLEKALLAIHKSYLHPVSALLNKVRIHGMAHITGGGLYDNIPRILPENVNACIDRATWKPRLYSISYNKRAIFMTRNVSRL